jgi:endoglucanase
VKFGAYSKADMDSRVKWTRFLSRWFEQQGFSWAYWEWNSGFGIYDTQTKTYRTQLVDALTKDTMPAVQSVN